jgi:hypothetical protein
MLTDRLPSPAEPQIKGTLARRGLRRRRVAARALLVPGLLVILAACSANPGPTGGPTGSGQPTGGPSSAPTLEPGSIDHPQGATDVVFRFEEGGGFVPMDFFATQGPQFTLYGDGTVIFRDGTASPPPSDGIANRLTPYSIGHLSEGEMQSFLRFALADSGLGVARASYNPGNVADAPTATFTLNAGGLVKTVSVEALGFDNPQSPDAGILKAMAALGDRLRNFAPSVEGETVWAPDRFRGVLTDDAVGVPQAWPWTDIAPADFVQRKEPTAPQFRIHTLTAAQADALGLAGIEGGFSSLALNGPDGKVYTLALRPILPDEAF